MALDLVVLDRLFIRECEGALRAFKAEVVAVVHVLPYGSLGPEPPATTVALVCRACMARRTAVVLAGSKASWELSAARPALEVAVIGHVV